MAGRHCVQEELAPHSRLTCDKEHSGCDEGCYSPAVLLEDGSGQKHHDKGDSAGG